MVPEEVVRYGRHFDNQFQVPVLFFLTILAGAIYLPQDKGFLVLAWIFVITRFAHSWIHLGKNNVVHRAQAYLAGWIVLLLLWLTLLFKIQ